MFQKCNKYKRIVLYLLKRFRNALLIHAHEWAHTHIWAYMPLGTPTPPGSLTEYSILWRVNFQWLRCVTYTLWLRELLISQIFHFLKSKTGKKRFGSISEKFHSWQYITICNTSVNASAVIIIIITNLRSNQSHSQQMASFPARRFYLMRGCFYIVRHRRFGNRTVFLLPITEPIQQSTL